MDQKDFSKCCEQNKENSFIANAFSAPTTFACLSEDLGREKKIERKSVEVNKLQDIEQENDKLKSNNFYGYELSCNKIYNHYISISSVNILEAILISFRSRKNAKNIILCKTNLTCEDEIRG